MYQTNELEAYVDLSAATKQGVATNYQKNLLAMSYLATNTSNTLANVQYDGNFMMLFWVGWEVTGLALCVQKP